MKKIKKSVSQRVKSSTEEAQEHTTTVVEIMTGTTLGSWSVLSATVFAKAGHSRKE